MTDLGSSLFDAICFLPEYYVLRAESEILTSFRDEIVRSFGPRILLDALTERQPDLEYVAVDIDEAMLERTGRDLLNEYASLRVTAVAANFTNGGQAIQPVLDRRDRLRRWCCSHRRARPRLRRIERPRAGTRRDARAAPAA